MLLKGATLFKGRFAVMRKFTLLARHGSLSDISSKQAMGIA